MGMISVKSKLKNQIYTITAFVGNWYLLYIGIRFIQNGVYTRGLLLLAIFLIFLYFSIMNIYYYFTNKQAPFDISPILEKYIGGTPEEVREKEEFRRRLTRVERQSRQVASPGGVFDQKALLPATIVSSARQQKNIEQIAEKMIQSGMVFMDYGGRTDEELRAEMPAQQTETYAIGDLGVAIPYAEVQLVAGKPTVVAGMNQMEAVPVGEITKVGLSSYQAAKAENHLYLANAFLIGGEKKVRGRSGMIVENEPYRLKINIAYKRRQTSLSKWFDDKLLRPVNVFTLTGLFLSSIVNITKNLSNFNLSLM